MDSISFAMLLEYLYQKFIVTFILCLIGSFIKESIGGTTKPTRLNPLKILVSALFASILMCAVVDYIDLPFSIYALIAVVVGIWSPQLVQTVMNAKFMKRFTRNFFKQVSDPIAKAAVAAAEELDKENKDEDEGDDESPPSEKPKDES